MTAPPYGFVPVVPRIAVTDAPVLHHGANAHQETLLSGELRLTLKTLTPLLIGHDRYRADQVKGQSPFEQGLVRLPPNWGIDFPVQKEKSIVEPLRLDGRVLIPGSALTGMLRHSLGALLSAPMERVAERTYSYRPNIAHAGKYDPVLYASRPAIVLAVDPMLKVKVLPEARAAVFLRGGTATRDDQWVWQRLGSPSAGTPLNKTYPEVRLDVYKDVIHLIPAPPGAVQAPSRRWIIAISHIRAAWTDRGTWHGSRTTWTDRGTRHNATAAPERPTATRSCTRPITPKECPWTSTRPSANAITRPSVI